MTPPLAARIARFIERAEGSFEALAVEAHAAQCEENPILAAIAGGRRAGHWDEIPAIPVSLFKELDLGPPPPLPTDLVFRTSGTTGQVRGVHRSRDTLLYDVGTVQHARARVRNLPRRIVSLCPDEADSSLAHMLRRLGEVEPCFAEGRVTGDAWVRLQSNGPVFLAATAFALDALFAMEGAAALGPESVVMVTGGFKGRRVRLDAPSLYAAIPARLGAPRVVGEYGMTELSSQLWTDPVGAGALPGSFLAPRWLRVYCADPMTGRRVPGEGVLRFVDLANAGSVLAIETQDMGRVESDESGDRVTLVGRLEGSELRGCSLRAEEAFARI